jgi:membrane protein required for colicin V production
MRTHLLDVLVFTALAIAAVQGWRRGFVLEVLNIVGLLVGVVVGFMLYDVVAGWVEPHLKMPGWILKTVAFLVTSLIVFRFWQWLSQQAKESFKVAGLGVADAILGSVFGLLKTSLVIAGLFWLGNVLHLTYIRNQLADSYIAADVVTLGNEEFSLLSKATPLFQSWYQKAAAFAFSPTTTGKAVPKPARP